MGYAASVYACNNYKQNIGIRQDVNKYQLELELSEILYLVSNVVRQPVQPLIKPFPRGGTCALDVPENHRKPVRQH